MLSKDQKQSTGNNCTAIQANVININNSGLSYEDVKQIFYDLFEANFYRLSDAAKEIVESRTHDFIDKFLHELKIKNPDGIDQATDPDFQYDLLVSQREFARSGDSEQANMLISLLVERTKETKRSLCQIVLNESLTIVPKLTTEEIDILSVMFVLMHHIKRVKFNNEADLADYIAAHILPFCNSLKKEAVADGHLIYTGCGSYVVFKLYDLNEFLNSLSISDRNELSNLINTLNNTYTNMKPFFDLFNSELINHIFLTSVGVTIGYANLCLVTGEEFNLHKWIY